MKTSQLNLLILDDNSLIGNPLSEYLNNRFGSRINLSLFADGDECIRNIDHNSHILILNYAMDGEDKGAQRRGEIFQNIKKMNPKTEVTMLTSKQGVFDATREIQQNVSDYIRRKERYLHDALVLLDKSILAPIKNRIIHPLRKLAKNYIVISYAAVILTCIALSIAVVVTLFKAIKYFN